MCEVLDRVENKGRLEGELKGKQETAINLHNMGMDNNFIAKAVRSCTNNQKCGIMWL